MLKKIDHIGIAVKDLEKAIGFYEGVLGMKHDGTSKQEARQLKAAMMDCGGVHLELLESMAPGSVIAKFIEKRGEGIHHICYEVDDVRATLARLKAAGLRLVDEEPRPGVGGCLVAFVHPASTGGVLLEVSQKPSRSQRLFPVEKK